MNRNITDLLLECAGICRESVNRLLSTGERADGKEIRIYCADLCEHTAGLVNHKSPFLASSLGIVREVLWKVAELNTVHEADSDCGHCARLCREAAVACDDYIKMLSDPICEVA